MSSACRIARAGWLCRELSGPATVPCEPISAIQVSPSCCARVLLITTTAAAPSEIGEEVPAVIVPSAPNAGRSLASVSCVVSGRIPSSSLSTRGSPRFCGTDNAVISSANTPFFCAVAARWCEAAPKASCSARLIPYRLLCRSVDSPIDTPS